MYRVACRQCGTVKEFHANSLPDPRIRKWYMQRGWEIGKHTNSHTCPECVKKAKPAPLQYCSFCFRNELAANLLIGSPLVAAHTPKFICDECVLTCLKLLHEQTGETRTQLLWSAWNACSEGERQEFVATVAPPPPPVTVAAILDTYKEDEPKPMSEWQHGAHIDSMPTQPPLAENPAPVSVLEDEPADDEPADWWKELNAKRA